MRSLITTALLLLMMTSCAEKRDVDLGEHSPDTTRTALIEPENALSEELMICLGQARNFHHKADVLLGDEKLSEAAKAVALILDIPFPKDAPESEDALLDTRARLAKLYTEMGELEKAMKLADEGIATTTRRSFFLANLHTVRGEVFEAMAKLAEPGSAESSRAKIQAIEALDMSIQINNELLEALGAKSVTP